MSGKASASHVGSKQRTLFVGKGLGFRHNEQLDSQIHSVLNNGSAKSLVKKLINSDDYS